MRRFGGYGPAIAGLLMLYACSGRQASPSPLAMVRVPVDAPIPGGPQAPFDIGKYEVTRGEWEALMGPIGGADSRFAGRLPLGEPRADAPIGNVNMPDAEAFCARLSAQTGDTYRLPTVAEWRYACKAGAQTRFPWGDAFDPAYAWCFENARNEVQPVGQKKPNAFGLYDMIGNVREICAYDLDDEERRRPWRMGGSVGMSCDALPEVLGFSQHWGDGDSDSGLRVVREVP